MAFGIFDSRDIKISRLRVHYLHTDMHETHARPLLYTYTTSYHRFIASSSSPQEISNIIEKLITIV